MSLDETPPADRNPHDRRPGAGGDDGLRRAVARGSTARLLTTVVAVGCMAGTGVVTARALGPGGKGVVSSLSYLISVVGNMATLGLADAAIVRYGRRRTGFDAAARASVAGTLAASVAAMAVAVVVGGALTGSFRFGLLTAASVPSFAVMHTMIRLAEGRGRVGYAGGCYAFYAAATLAATWLLVVVFELGIEGGLLALVAGPLAACAALVRGAPRARPRPSEGGGQGWPPLRPMLGPGLPMMGANVLRILSRRLDALVVLALLGPAEAGLYSVALTFGEIALYAPGALATATFPRLAQLEEGPDADLLVAQLTRVTIVITLGLALPLALVASVVVPAVFGADFEGAVTPAVILLLASPAISVPWLLARALAAHGDTTTVFRSAAVTTSSMLALDLILVPWAGIAGAAFASGAACVIGAAVAVRAHRRHAGAASLWGYVPGIADVLLLARWVARRR